MGLFSRKKKEEPVKQQASTDTNESEFDKDIRELLGRDDIQCRQDICAAEYEKAQKLLETPTQDCVMRAYDLMGNLASRFDYVPAIMWMGDFAENAMQDLPQAVFWYKKAADLGDGNGARCYADMLMVGNGVQQDSQQAIHYYAVAADKGVPEAAFVIGEFLRSSGDIENALKSYQQAYDGGYELAQIRINQIKGE